MTNYRGDHSTGAAAGRAPQNASAGSATAAGTASAERIDPTAASQETYDVIIIGAGTSGLNIARELAVAGLSVLGLEAGKRYDRHTYPRTEIDSSSQLFWGGGVELTTDAGLGLLRPKAVGGGSIVNQALMDRFDDVAFSSWRDQSGVSWLNEDHLAPYYERAEGNMILKNVPEEWRNGNAKNFADGFDANGYRYAPLRRGEADCRFEDGNCCVECLSGCSIDSKQSTAVTALPAAENHGFHLIDCAEARTITEHPDRVTVTTRVPADNTPKGRRGFGKPTNFEPQVERTFTARRVVLASGAIGNTALLLRSGYGKQLPGLGKNFFTHPQYMNLAATPRTSAPSPAPCRTTSPTTRASAARASSWRTSSQAQATSPSCCPASAPATRRSCRTSHAWAASRSACATPTPAKSASTARATR